MCIPIEPKQLGGSYTFLDNWRQRLRQNNVAHTADPMAEYDVLFVNSFMVPYDLIASAKRARPKLVVVQRVDGSARDYGRFDDADDRQARVNMLADLTIFQSRYSRHSTTEKYRVIQQDGPVIYNPVDTRTFCPGETASLRDGRPQVCNASHSDNPKKGTWMIGDLARANPDVDFILCGHYPPLPELPNIRLCGRLGREDLARTLRSCHAFVHLAENDPCPNVVLEALASGLPVLYRDSGGTPELVEACGLPVTSENFRGQLDTVMSRLDELSAAARQRAVGTFARIASFHPIWRRSRRRYAVRCRQPGILSGRP